MFGIRRGEIVDVSHGSVLCWDTHEHPVKPFTTLRPGTCVQSAELLHLAPPLPIDLQSQMSTKVYDSLQSKQQHPHIIPKYSALTAAAIFPQLLPPLSSSYCLTLLFFFC